MSDALAFISLILPPRGIILDRHRFEAERLEERLEGIKVDARSLGGIGTTITFPEMDLTIDMGACTPAALRTGTAAFTHTHADHISGLPTYLGVRRLFGMKDPRFIVPKDCAPAFRDMVAALGALQGRPFDAVVDEVALGSDVPLGNDLFLHPFAVDHGVPGVGLSVVRRVKKLKSEYLGLPGPEIARLKEAPGSDMFSTVDDPLVAVTGDTTVEGADFSDPMVSRARVLFVECTFVDEKRDPEYAHLGGHIHLWELADLLEGVESGAIVLYHFSQIYKTAELEEAVRNRLPPEIAQRVTLLLPEEADRL